MQIRDALVDFARVKSTTLSFMDEFYHLLVSLARRRPRTPAGCRRQAGAGEESGA